jgi:hypothetical protein
MARTSLVVACLIAAAATRLPAQSPASTPPRITSAVRRDGPVEIDGRLDEAAWARSPVTDDFVQSFPKPNAPALDRTEVRVLYDDDALYVGVRMFDAHPDSIVAQLARHDPSSIYTDWAHVIIDSYHDRRTAFAFSVNPLGVTRDALEYNDIGEDVNWDAVWQAAATIDSLGWTAEFRIPFSQLRFGGKPPDEARVWGFEVFRDVARRNERDAWAPWDPAANALVSRFGDLVGLVGVRSRMHAEFVPYVSSKLTRAPAQQDNPFFRANAEQPSVGGDVKLALPRGLTLTGAINPDFGQVEVDPAVVNLSAYETFFPEKRPFFVEGSGIFSFGQVRNYNDYQFQQYFYSRRVGRPPARTIDAPFVDAPDATHIAGSAKLSGRMGAWTLGVLDAVTPSEQAHFRASSDASTQSAPVEPLANYFAGRLKRDYRQGHTVVGAMLTSVDRAMGDTAFAPLLHDHAEFGGVDFEHGWGHGSWFLTGFAAGSRVAGASGTRGSIAATQRAATHYFQRPDAAYLHYDTTQTSLEGATGELSLQRTGSIAASVSFKTVTPGFEINDLGFLNRADYHALSTLLGYQSFTAGRLLRTHSEGAFTNQAWNYGGTRFYNAASLFSNFTFTNFWFGGLNLTASAPVLSDRLTRGGPLALTPGTLTGGVGMSSDSRREVFARANLVLERDGFDGGHYVTPSFSLNWRPASFVTASIGPTLTKLVSSNQYVTTVADPTATMTYANRYVFARLQQTTFSAETRLDWTFTPKLSLQVYAQPFVSAGHYAEFKELARPSSADFARYGKSAGTIDTTSAGYRVDPDAAGPAQAFTVVNPDFNIRSLRGNAVLRWEYRPGSALFVVWQQQRAGSQAVGDFDFTRDVGAIFRAPVTNVLLVKLTYWFSA